MSSKARSAHVPSTDDYNYSDPNCIRNIRRRVDVYSCAGGLSAAPSFRVSWLSYSLVIPRLTDVFVISTTLGTNFTSTACPSFFETFLADPTLCASRPCLAKHMSLTCLSRSTASNALLFRCF